MSRRANELSPAISQDVEIWYLLPKTINIIIKNVKSAATRRIEVSRIVHILLYQHSDSYRI